MSKRPRSHTPVHCKRITGQFHRTSEQTHGTSRTPQTLLQRKVGSHVEVRLAKQEHDWRQICAHRACVPDSAQQAPPECVADSSVPQAQESLRPPEGAKLQTLSHRMRCRSPFLPSCIQLAKNHSGLRGGIL